MNRIASNYRLLKWVEYILSFWLVGQIIPFRVRIGFLKKIRLLTQKDEDNLSYQSIIEYLRRVADRYNRSSKKEKTKILEHAKWVTGFHRKSIIRFLSREDKQHRRQGRCGRKTVYPPALKPHIRKIWIAMQRPSAGRMHAALKEWLEFYPEPLSQSHQEMLLKMSRSTLERFLREIRSTPSKGLSSTSPAKHMQSQVPINTLDAHITRPGYMQADTVAHCGDRLSGAFINTITLTDIFSAWTVNQATMTKKGREVRSAFSAMLPGLPFKLIAINTDSGSEFLNQPVVNQFRNEKIIFTRSRPYKKNDNCYVEQKNYTHVRLLTGYQRFEDPGVVSKLNSLYRSWNDLWNFFLPTYKLKRKVRIGARIKKIYGPPITPYQRLMDSPHLSESQKKALKRRKAELSPFELNQQIEKKLSEIFELSRRYSQIQGGDNAA